MPKEDNSPDKDSYSDLVGLRLGDYVIDNFVAAGGQAVVYAAHLADYPQRKRAYALKIFGLSQSGSGGLKVGLKEAKKLASIDHPAVVRFYPPDVADLDFQGESRRILF